MCARFVITSPPAALRQIFGYIEQPDFPPRHNIAPTQPIPIIILENGVRHFRLMRWGLLPAGSRTRANSACYSMRARKR
jgi:putative SOS response-associated peptidase YedK